MAGEVGDDEAAWRDLVAQYRTPAAAEGAAPWPAQEDPDATQAPAQECADPVPGVIPTPPQARVIRSAVPAPPPPAGDDEHYIPPDPPPLPRLDPVTKGAWAALFGGPGYLLVAVLLGWVVPGWIALCVDAAVVAGFAMIEVRMGDGTRLDSRLNAWAEV